MPQCFKCGAELTVNEEGVAPVLCDSCAGVATKRARRTINTGTLRDFPVTTTLIAINVAVYGVMVLTSGSLSFGGGFLIRWGGNFGPYTVSGDYWRLLSSAFVHGGFLHMAMDMWCLLLLGRISERLFGRWQTAAIYVLTGIGGSLLSIAYEATRLSVGASGAIFGIGGAILVGLKFGNLSISAGERKSILGTVVFFVVVSFVLGMQSGSTDNMCHLGGFFSGLIIGLPLATSLGASHGRTALFHAITLSVIALLLVAGGYQLVQSRRIFGVQRALRQNDWPAAIKLMEQNATANPRSAEAQGLLGEGYLEHGDFDKAVPVLERAVKLDSTSADWQAALGEAYEQNREPDKAIAAYEQALKLNPSIDGVEKALQELRANNPPKK